MLKILTKVCNKQTSIPIRYLQSEFIQKLPLSPKCSIHVKFKSNHIRQLSARASAVLEETLSYKVLDHIQKNGVESALRDKEETMPSVGMSDERYALKQTLMVIAHSSEAKTSDILKLFKLYASCSDLLLQSLVSDRSLMKAVLSKIDHSFHHMNARELKELALSLKELRKHKIRYIYIVSRSLALHCEKLSAESNLSDALELFRIVLILYGNLVAQKPEFNTFMSTFENNISSAQPFDLVQILHFIGMGKSKRLSQEFASQVSQQLEPLLHLLSFTNAGIAASGLFKSNTVLDKSSHLVVEMAKQVKSKLEGAPHLSVLESFAFISIIKLLRKAKYKDDDLTFCVTKFVRNVDESFFDPQVIPHLLSFYANLRIYEQDIFSKLENLTLQHLRNSSHDYRIKDVSKVLWCFSHTGHEYSSELSSRIDKYLLDFAHGPEIAKNSHLLTDSLLSLAMGGHYPHALIKKAFNPELIKGLQEYQRSKQLSRLLSLNECLKIEVPDLTVECPPMSRNKLPVRTLSDEIFYRQGLSKLMGGVNFINEILGVKVFKLRFLIPTINYANLIVDFKQLDIPSAEESEDGLQRDHIIKQLASVRDNSGNQPMAVELLEPEFLIQPASKPIGFVNLKLRLLKKLGWDIKILSFEEVEQCKDDTRAIAALLIDRLT